MLAQRCFALVSGPAAMPEKAGPIITKGGRRDGGKLHSAPVRQNRTGGAAGAELCSPSRRCRRAEAFGAQEQH